MGILGDLGNYLLNIITRRNRIQALPEERKETTDREGIFRLKIQEAARKNGINEISNGGDLITIILTYLGANSKIVNHKATKEELQTFIMGILEQNDLDTRYFAEEDIKKMITAIKQSRVIEGTNIIPFNGREGLHYGIGIDDSENGNGSIEVTIYNQDVLSEKYSYKLNESGNLCVKRDIYRIGYIDGNQIYESIDVEYDNKGIEQKREAKEWTFDKWSRRILGEHVRTDRYAKFPFVAKQSVIVSGGKNVANPKMQCKVLSLDSLNRLDGFHQINPGRDVILEGEDQIKEYWRYDSAHGNRISLMLEAFGISSRDSERY